MSDSKTLRWLERGLFITGAAAAVLYAGMNVPAVIARVQTLAPASSDGPVIPPSTLGFAYLHGSGAIEDGTKIGTITVPQLHLTAPVVEGVQDGDLRRGVGHVPGSAQSGGLGNMVLAAHRDTVFRSLRSIAKGMDIQVTGTDGTYHYVVDSLQVVAPDRLDVMEISAQPEVTLITCYPFNFIGSAPMRFIVKAHLVSPVPDVPAT
jgi:LPXTG-site transpeptidase (sortase) family protein